MINILILDFDSAVLELVEVKTEAFRKLFSFAPDHIEEIVEFHRQNGGMSWFDKIHYIYAEILKKNRSPKNNSPTLPSAFPLWYLTVSWLPLRSMVRKCFWNVILKRYRSTLYRQPQRRRFWILSRNEGSTSTSNAFTVPPRRNRPVSERFWTAHTRVRIRLSSSETPQTTGRSYMRLECTSSPE